MVELLVYVAGLLALGAVLIMLIAQFYGLYREIVAQPRADRTALLLMDRLTKDLRSAQAVDTLNSEFSVTDGAIEFDSNDEGVITEKRYYVENGVVRYQENGGSAVSLTPRDLTVSNFGFALVSTDVSEAVRITMELQFQSANGTGTKSYTGFAILRESYE